MRIFGEDFVVRCFLLVVVGLWRFVKCFFFGLYFFVNKLCRENFFFCLGENCKGEIVVVKDIFWGVFLEELGFFVIVGFFFGELWEYDFVKDLVLVNMFVLVECL